MRKNIGIIMLLTLTLTQTSIFASSDDKKPKITSTFLDLESDKPALVINWDLGKEYTIIDESADNVRYLGSGCVYDFNYQPITPQRKNVIDSLVKFNQFDEGMFCFGSTYQSGTYFDAYKGLNKNYPNYVGILFGSENFMDQDYGLSCRSKEKLFSAYEHPSLVKIIASGDGSVNYGFSPIDGVSNIYYNTDKNIFKDNNITWGENLKADVFKERLLHGGKIKINNPNNLQFSANYVSTSGKDGYYNDKYWNGYNSYCCNVYTSKLGNDWYMISKGFPEYKGDIYPVYSKYTQNNIDKDVDDIKNGDKIYTLPLYDIETNSSSGLFEFDTGNSSQQQLGYEEVVSEFKFLKGYTNKDINVNTFMKVNSLSDDDSIKIKSIKAFIHLYSRIYKDGELTFDIPNLKCYDTSVIKELKPNKVNNVKVNYSNNNNNIEISWSKPIDNVVQHKYEICTEGLDRVESPRETYNFKYVSKPTTYKVQVEKVDKTSKIYTTSKTNFTVDKNQVSSINIETIDQNRNKSDAYTLDLDSDLPEIHTILTKK